MGGFTCTGRGAEALAVSAELSKKEPWGGSSPLQSPLMLVAEGGTYFGWALAAALQPPLAQHHTVLLLTGLNSCAAWLEKELSCLVSTHRVTLKTGFSFRR